MSLRRMQLALESVCENGKEAGKAIVEKVKETRGGVILETAGLGLLASVPLSEGIAAKNAVDHARQHCGDGGLEHKNMQAHLSINGPMVSFTLLELAAFLLIAETFLRHGSWKHLGTKELILLPLAFVVGVSCFLAEKIVLDPDDVQTAGILSSCGLALFGAIRLNLNNRSYPARQYENIENGADGREKGLDEDRFTPEGPRGR